MMNTQFYDHQRRAFPAIMGNATKLTREGTVDAKRYGGPGKRSKNPVQYDRIGKERANAAAN
jgi:hypothetical protein